MKSFIWAIKGKVYRCELLPQTCPNCKTKTRTLVGLPPPILKDQPDETNVVCHPNLGGCNHGFHLDIPNEYLWSREE